MNNRPQPGHRLKYFMRLVAIGIAYRRAESGTTNQEAKERELSRAEVRIKKEEGTPNDQKIFLNSSF